MNVRRLVRAISPAVTATLLLFPAVAVAKTYYVDVVTGDDTRSSKTATSPSTPVKTIKVGLSFANPGDTVIVKPGLYREAVESKRDGLFGASITLKSETAGGATIQPLVSTSNGVFISHNYFTIDGFDITGGLKGIKAGDHDGGGPIFGVVVKNNEVYGNSDIGVQFENAQGSVADSNVIHNNGCHGIKYQGNAGIIKNNVVQNNGATCAGGGHGIWVVDGVDYQVFDNTSTGNAAQQIKIDGSLLPPPGGFRFIYYVAPAPTGDDSRSKTAAQNESTPLATIKKALSFAVAGDTVMVLDGTYQESVESKVDGASDSPITIKAKNALGATIDPPQGNGPAPGFYIGHNYHVIEGFVVDATNAPNGIQVGPHSVGDATVTGVVISDNEVFGANSVGIKFSNAVNGKAQHNVVYQNGGDGIFYKGSNGTIFNNLVYSNKNGITLDSGSGHQVINNTAFANSGAGIRIGTDANVPVSATVLNNISAQNSTGIREQPDMRATSTINYNNVPGPGFPNANGTPYALGRSVVGPNSLNADPGFVNPGALDFRLGRIATGQARNSACIDAGDQTATARGLSSWTAFTDKAADTGIVDLGFHGTPIVPAQGTIAMEAASLNFVANGNDDFTLRFVLAPGAASDGINLGEEYAQISLGGMQFTLPVTGFTSQGSNVWRYTGASGITSGTFTKLGDGSVRVEVIATGQNLSASESQIPLQAQIGDDFASTAFKVQGTLFLAP